MRNVYIRLGAVAYSLFIWALLAQFAMAQGTNPGVTAVSPRTAWDIIQWNSNTQIVGQGRTLTTNQPARIAQTWNNAGVTFTSARVAVTDTASNSASLLMDFQVGGSTVTQIRKDGGVQSIGGGTSANPFIRYSPANTNGIYFPADGSMAFVLTSSGRIRFSASAGMTMQAAWPINWSASSDPLAATDLSILRDAANTLAQRNGTAAQEHRLYFTYTDASNYARLSSLFGSGAGGNAAIIRTEQAGTGGARNLAFGTSGTVRWGITTSGHLLAEADNTYDIGASGATRPRTIYAATSIVSSGPVTSGSGDGFLIGSRSRLTSPADAQLYARNNANSAFSDVSLLGVQTVGVAFGSLPTCNAGLAGMRRHITDGAAAPAFMAAAAGGGAVVTPVFCDGAAWVNG